VSVDYQRYWFAVRHPGLQEIHRGMVDASLTDERHPDNACLDDLTEIGVTKLSSIAWYSDLASNCECFTSNFLLNSRDNSGNHQVG
jgi:hypothetical protein